MTERRTGSSSPRSRRATSGASGRATADRPARSRRAPTPTAGAEAPSRPTGVRRRRAAIVATFVAVMVVLVALPGRGYFQERGDVAAADAALARLERQNEELEKRRAGLDDPAEIERVARRDYGLVDEGEESYSVLPPASAGLVLPNAWPFDRLEASVRQAASG